MNENNHSFERMRDLFEPARASGRASNARPGIVFDPAKCTGCGLCELACASGGSTGKGPRTPMIQVLRDDEAGTSFAVACQHCLDPQCMKACPNGALSRGEDGIVRHDRQLCVDCGLCIAACPEAAPLRGADGKVVKCDLCGGDPACVKACPQGAISYTRGSRRSWIAPLRWLCQLVSLLLFAVVFTGSVCSLNLATFDIACPFGALQNVFSAKFILLTTVAAALLLLGLTFVLGRVFCGWMCPFGFILDLVGSVMPRRPLFRLPAFLRSRLNKYAVAAGGLAAAGASGTQAFCVVCPIGTVCRSHGLNSFMPAAESAIIPVLASMEAGERRSWCRYLCPVGAVFGLAAKFGLVRIEIGASKCKKFSCMRCADICPMGVIPKDRLVQGLSPRIDMAECITCLRCVSVCPHRAASVRFVWQKPRTRRGTVPGCPCGKEEK